MADLTLRASFSQAFYAPDLIDLYNPGFGSFPELSDPFYPADDPNRLYQVETFYVGSQVTGVPLQPEESDVYSVGLTYSPSQVEGLDITVDWWQIKTTNLIVYSVQGLLSEFRDSYPGGNNGSMTHPPADNPYLEENGGPIVYDPKNETLMMWNTPKDIPEREMRELRNDIAPTFDLEDGRTLSPVPGFSLVGELTSNLFEKVKTLKYKGGR